MVDFGSQCMATLIGRKESLTSRCSTARTAHHSAAPCLASLAGSRAWLQGWAAGHRVGCLQHAMSGAPGRPVRHTPLRVPGRMHLRAWVLSRLPSGGTHHLSQLAGNARRTPGCGKISVSFSSGCRVKRATSPVRRWSTPVGMLGKAVSSAARSGGEHAALHFTIETPAPSRESRPSSEKQQAGRPAGAAGLKQLRRRPQQSQPTGRSAPAPLNRSASAAAEPSSSSCSLLRPLSVCSVVEGILQACNGRCGSRASKKESVLVASLVAA